MEKRKSVLCKENDEIIQLIEDAPRVWVSTDWHAVKFDKKTHKIFNRDEYDKIKEACSVIKPDDVWIFLGDMIDSEISGRTHIDKLLDCIHTDKRILLLGNNDRWDDYSKWFMFVENTILLPDRGVVLTHCPIPNDERINIHGHIHVREHDRPGAYWAMYDVKPANHVNAFTWPHKPVLLSTLIRRRPNPYVQHIPGMKAKPYTADLVKNEIRDYKILRDHYDKTNSEEE